MAFAPANMIPGIEPSPDKMLQARLMSYVDTHRHRLGPNYAMIPVNCPLRSIKMGTYNRGGYMNVDTQVGGAPNYFPNSFGGPQESPHAGPSKATVSGEVARYCTANDDNYSQVTTFWTNVLDQDGKKHLAYNIADHLRGATDFIQQRVVKNFSSVHPDLAKMIREGLGKLQKKSNL